MKVSDNALGNLFRKSVEIYRREDVLLVEWILVALISFVAFSIFRYRTDFHTLTVWTLNLIEVTFDGRIMEFYYYSAQNRHGVLHTFVGNEIFSLIPWAIWNIPLWILYRFFDVSIFGSIFPIFWSKLFLVLCLGVTALHAYKIGMIITADKARSRWMALLTLSCITAYIGVYYTSQNDIIAIAFSAIAVYYLLKERMWLFILFTAFSIATKPFFVFAFLALLLLHEKNILKIASYLICGFGVMIISRIIFYNAPMYQESLAWGPMDGTIGHMIRTGITMGFGHASYLIMAFIILYYLCFLARPEKPRMQIFTIYAPAFVYLMWMVISSAAYYRIIMLIPFLPILFMLNKRTVKISMLIYTLITLMMVIMLMGDFHVAGHDLFATHHMIMTPLDALFPGVAEMPRHYHNLLFMTRDLIPDFFYPIINAVILIGALILMFINFPGQTKPVPFENEKCDRWILWCNIFMVVPFLVGMLYTYFNVVRSV